MKKHPDRFIIGIAMTLGIPLFLMFVHPVLFWVVFTPAVLLFVYFLFQMVGKVRQGA